MQIITSHERADMDALASMYAAHLLYPEHQVVLPTNLNRNLRDFMALYRDEMPAMSRRKLPRRPIEHVILVDTQAIAPLRGMDHHTQIHVIDHHRLSEPLSDGVTYEIEMLGACTTLLIEKLRERGIGLDSLGASLLLMGIYEDTGSLTYGTTTARDAAAAAWLLDCGADLEFIHQFLRQPLSDDQRAALDRLVSNSAIHTVQGRTICIAAIALEHYVDELASLIHQIMDVYEPDACFVLAEYEGSVQIIARSTTEAINVATIADALGGGGHSKASAARVDGESLNAVSQHLLNLLEEKTEPPVLVRELMSTNVHTLTLNMSVRDAAQLMQRYGHEGFPVVEGERLLGVVTRSDIDRALHHRRGEMSIRSVLHTGALHVCPQDSVDEVQRVMIDHGLGQVPVVEEGRFVGIVTRTDLINLFAPRPQASRAQEIQRLMREVLPRGLRELLVEARDVANDQGHSLYIVGGFVRDLLLGVPNLDLDLVVEGDAIQMAHALAPHLGGRVRSHARFGTAKIILDGERPEGVPPALDFVTARTEFYERPSVLPTVESSSIKQDLYRRDFTINTLAICLDRDRYGELLDFYGGETDLLEKQIRVLHSLSFVEDPTRILRAVRFEQRLGFTIESRTAELIDDALDLIDHVTGERLRHELLLILEEERPELALHRLERMGVLERIHPSLRFGGDKVELFARLRRRLQEESTAPEEGQIQEIRDHTPQVRLCYLALLTCSMDRAELDSFAERLRIRSEHTQFLHEVTRLRESMSELQASVMLPSSIYRWLHPFSREARFVLSVLSDSELVRQRLEIFQEQLASVSPQIDGHFLRSLGVTPGPIYGEILERVRDALLDGQIASLAEEERLAKSLVMAAHGRPPQERQRQERPRQ
ncbi:MAG: CBS domain-containing protein [Anaerolineae bacterium]|nr:CBS domain-containing protein [Anaerolineae bacterium]